MALSYQQQQGLGSLLGGLVGIQAPAGNFLGQQQAQEYQMMASAGTMRPTVSFKRYSLPKSFIEGLRTEIDNWLHS